jgi:small-conductance mechanosensitive channel
MAFFSTRFVWTWTPATLAAAVLPPATRSAAAHLLVRALFTTPTWMPSLSEFRNALIVFLAAQGILWLLWAWFRERLQRKSITRLVLLGAQLVALYLALWFLHPQRMNHPLLDAPAWWIKRIFIVLLVIVGLQLLDRLALIPLLTRGGKLPLPRFIHQIILLVAYVFAVLGFCSWAFHLDINKFLAGSAIITVVLGLALQEPLGNFFSGMVMQTSSPFTIGDWVTCAGVEGQVVDMTWRAVTLLTLEDNYVLVPNSMMAREKIVNYHTPTVATARTIGIGLEYSSPPDQVREVLLEAMRETPGVLASPPPMVYLSAFGDSSIEYHLRFWINKPREHMNIESRVRILAWYRLRAAGMSMPFPIRTVQMVDPQKDREQARAAEVQRRVELLSRVPLLAPLPADDMTQLARNVAIRFLAAGDTLYRQDDPGRSLFVIQRGAVELRIVRNAGRGVHCEALHDGEYFGELSALMGTPRAGSVCALAETVCFEIGSEALERIFRNNPKVLENVSRVVADRHAQRVLLLRDMAPSEGSANQPAELHQSLLQRMKSFFALR